MTTREGAPEEHRDNRGRFTKETPTAYKPGQSGNPEGRPPNKKYISEGLREILEGDSVLLMAVLHALIRKAKKGDVLALRELADRTEGKVTDVHEVIITEPAKYFNVPGKTEEQGFEEE